MKTIAFLNLKGGVGKTVSTINIAAILAKDYEKGILVIDADSQGNTTAFLGGTPGNGNLTNVLLAPADSAADIGISSIQQTELKHVQLLAASDGLMDLDISAIKGGSVNVTGLRDMIISFAAENSYDYVLIDCPPAFNAATAAALLAADEVIIPIKLDAFSISGMANLIRQVENMRKINPRIRVAGCLVTMFYKSETMSKAYEILKDSPLPVFEKTIRRSGKVDGMTFAQKPLIAYSPHCAAGIDYRCFVHDHFVPKGGNRNGRL